MDSEMFKYVSVGSSQSGCDLVTFRLQRSEGSQFNVIMTADDAQNLCDSLRQQIRIAKFKV